MYGEGKACGNSGLADCSGFSTAFLFGARLLCLKKFCRVDVNAMCRNLSMMSKSWSDKHVCT